MAGSTALRFLPPLLLAAAVLAAAPFLGLLRDALLDRFPSGALRWTTVTLAAAAGAALLVAVARIRERRALRYAGLVLCAGLVAAQLAGFATGNAAVDVVERIHILEYGLLAALFYFALRPWGGPAVPVLGWLAAGLVGTLDEWVQWLVPTRVGEAGDVALNFAAAGTGTLFALCVAPLRGPRWRLAPAQRRAIALLAAAEALALGGLVHAAHLGYEVRDQGARLTFLSWYSPAQLPRVTAARERRWRTRPPTLDPLSREDRYFTEATWRVSHRNASLERGDLHVAWREQLILERHYAPVLRRRGLVSGEPLDLSAEWKEALRREDQPRARAAYRSPVLEHRIAVRPTKAAWWTGVGAAIAALLAVAAWPARRPAGGHPGG